MIVLTTVADMVKARDLAVRPLGLVPTMGYLHEGHLTLARQARQETRTVVASIFVNPTQFGPAEDFASYPRDMERDLTMLRSEGVDIVFAPTVDEMYPKGYSTYVDVEGVTKPLEGARRPGHFQGVATVVAKLFTIVRPDRSYFGQKDGQQVAVVKRMTLDLNLGTEIIVVRTVREPDGLAMSSRNVYLTPAERRAAPVLYLALCRVRELWQQGQRDAEAMRQEMVRLITSEPLAQVDYVSIAAATTLEELAQVNGPAMVSLAVRFGRTHLIDNISLP
ncbi:MAG: pantoate--beta-alanine ligase [Dehalococcoidia bacterium]|nr:pantoate--beta-alanine ligase [Dehalococcoidia bacterium]